MAEKRPPHDDIRTIHTFNSPKYDAKYIQNGKRVFFDERGVPFTMNSKGKPSFNFKGRKEFKRKHFGGPQAYAPAEHLLEGNPALYYAKQKARAIEYLSSVLQTNLNAERYDEQYTLNKKRIFFTNEGKAYQLKSNGHKNFKFKGHQNWEFPTIAANVAAKNYHIPLPGLRASTSSLPHVQMSYVAQVIDSNGNVIDNRIFNTRLFDIVDYKDRPLSKDMQKHIRRNAQDYIIAHQMMNLRAEMKAKKINGDIKMVTKLGDDLGVATHVMKSGSDEITLMRFLHPKAYVAHNINVPYDPMGIRTGTFDIHDVLNDDIMNRHMLVGPSQAYMSLRGLGLNPKGEVDKDAVAALFGKKNGRYRLMRDGKYIAISLDPNPIVLKGDGIDPVWSKSLHAAHELEKATNIESKPMFNREPVFDAEGNPVINKVDGEEGQRTKLVPTEHNHAVTEEPKPTIKTLGDVYRREQIDKTMSPDASIETVDDSNQTRLRVTQKIMDDFGGYEAYQYASEKPVLMSELSSRDDIHYEDGRYYKWISDHEATSEVRRFGEADVREDGTIGYRMYLQDTYDVHWNRVLADVREGSYSFESEQEAKTYHYFTRDMIDGKNTTSKPLSFMREIQDQLVLTDIGEKEYHRSTELARKLNEHKMVIDTFLDDLKIAKEKNTKEQIKLSGVVKEAFHLETDTISSMHAFTAFKGYLQNVKGMGLDTTTMLGADMQGGRAFNGVLSAVYRQRRVASNSGVYGDIRQWNQVASDVRNERIDVLWQTNEKADDKESMFVTEDEYENRLREEHGLDNEYKDRHYSLELEDEHERQLKHIENSLTRVDHSNEQAKKRIMNKIHQHIVEGQPMTPEIYDQMIAEENEKILPSILNQYNEKDQSAIKLVLGDDFTAEDVKTFAANPSGEMPLPSTEGYAFHQRFKDAGIERISTNGLLPNAFLESRDITYNEFNEHGVEVVRKGTETYHTLTDEEYDGFQKWTEEVQKRKEYNRGRELIINRLGNDKFYNGYHEMLAEVNAYRTANQKEPFASLVPQEMTKKKADEASVQRWLDFKENLEEHDQVFRLQGDQSLYSIKEVHQNGTVIAKRMTLPVTALDVQLKFEENINTIETVKKANNRIFPEELQQSYELTEAQKLSLTQNRSVAMGKLIANAKADIGAGSGQILPIDAATLRFLEKRELINLGEITGEGKRKVPMAFANRRLVDIMGARAGWMLRSGMTQEVASSINMAMMDTIAEFANEGKTINLASKGDVISSFDQDFEDRFTKHLHQRHFEFKNQDGAPKNASDVLIRDVAMVASQSLQEDPELRTKVGTPEFMHYVQAETENMLNEAAGDMIHKEFPYYREALKPGRIAAVLNDHESVINSTSLDTRFATEDRHAMNPLDNAMEKIDGSEVNDALSETEREFLKGDMTQKEFFVNKKTAQKELAELNRAAKHVEAMGVIPWKHIKKLEKLKFTHARKYFGDEMVDDLIQAKEQGKFQMPNEYELMKAYKEHRLDVLEAKEQIPGYGYEMIRAMHAEGGFDEGFFHQAMEETLHPNITDTHVLKSYLNLAEVMPEMDIQVSVNKNRLRQISPDIADMVPDGDIVTLKNGKQGDIIARSTSTDRTFMITDTTHVLGKEQPIEQTVAFHTADRYPDYNTQVERAWTRDAVSVGNPAGTIPLAMNSDYNVNRITRSPIMKKLESENGKEYMVRGNAGFMSSSDVASLSGVESIMKNGRSAIGLDFETTGLLTNKHLRDRGLILPTEVYLEKGKMIPSGWEVQEGKHMILDVGRMTDNKGVSVRQVVTDEIGKMNSQDLIKQSLGEAETRTWAQLGKDERLKVMSSDAMSLLRNLAKYSTEVNDKQRDAIKDFRNYTPDSLDKTFKDFVHHATIGLDNLSSRATHTDLASFMSDYDAMTKGNILVMQNGGDADIPWANHFAKQAGVEIDTQPHMIEMMHLSRLLQPEAKGHSLKAQVHRTNDGDLINLYENGSHMADTDVKAMMQVFGNHYLKNDNLTGEKGHANVEWMDTGDTLVRLGSRGQSKIPHDMYTVGDYNVSNGMHELTLTNPEGAIEKVRGASLQELQRNITQNYKGFKDSAKAKDFLADMTFDDAREDINAATLRYDDLVREMNRAENGMDTGLKNLKDHYNRLQEKAKKGVQGPLEDIDMKVLQHSHMLADDYYEPRVQPNYSDRQARAMTNTKEFFDSDDAFFRRDFLGEVKDLQSVGVINEEQGRNLVAAFNKQIRDKAEAVGALKKRSVAGLVDLGVLEGKQFGPSSGTRITALTNTFEQTEQSLWNVAEHFRHQTSDKVRNTKNGWKNEAVDLMIRHFKDNNIMSSDAGNQMDDAVEAVRAYHAVKKDMEVDDLRTPFIRDEYTDTMRQAYQEVSDHVLGTVEPVLNERPDLQDAYERTQEMRYKMEAHGMDVSGMDFRMASQYEGRNLPITGEYAFRDAKDLKTEVDALDPVENKDQHAALWKEIYHRATSAYDDAEDAQHILGWDSTPDEYIHPYAEGKNAAGTRYADMELDEVDHVRYHYREGDLPSPLAEKAAEYRNAVDSGEYIHGSEDTAAREAITGKLKDEVYEDEPLFERPDGRNRPKSDLEIRTSQARNSIMDGLRSFTEGGKGKAIGLIAAGLGAAFIARQWTRGDLAEERPQHDSSDTPASGHRSTVEAPPPPTPPSGGRTYLTEDSAHMNVQVSARNPGHASQDQIGEALQKGMGGRNANINIHHRDDTSAINTEWLQQKFSELLDKGFAVN